MQVHSSARSSSATTAAAAAASAASATYGQHPNEECHRFEMLTGKDSDLYEHIEAYNPMVGKRNIHNQFMSTNRPNQEQQQQQQHHQVEKIGKKSTTMSSKNEKHTQNKSQLIDRRQHENDNVNHLKNGMLSAASDRTLQQQQPKLRLKKSSSSSEIAATRPSTDTIATKASSNLSDESMITKTDRFPKQLPTDEVHHDDDVGSVGSFLSMASVRSFPKCNVPEPLNRVLEPVSITYLDQYDEIEATEAATMASKLPRIVNAKAKKSSTSTKPQPQPQSPPLPPPPPPVRSCKQHEHTGTKQNNDDIVYLSRTRSECADPGVIGPIAWQYHKKRLEDQRECNA